MTGIDGKARTVRDLLNGKHYAIDYYFVADDESTPDYSLAYPYGREA